MGGRLGAQNVNLAVEVAEPVHRGALGAGEGGRQRRGHGDVSEGASPRGVFRVVAQDEAAVFALRKRVADKEHLPVLIPVLPTQGADLVAPLAQRGERRQTASGAVLRTGDLSRLSEASAFASLSLTSIVRRQYFAPWATPPAE